VATITISEALAEIKTINKRLSKKEEFIAEHLMRPEQMRDPLEGQGGQRAAIISERQSMLDLQQRVVNIRLAIQQVNMTTDLTVLGVTKTMAAWLVWRRDVAPKEQAFLTKIRQGVAKLRQDLLKQGMKVVSGEQASGRDVLVNIDEKLLAEGSEHLERTLGELDGMLSLKNATIMITLPD